MHGFKLSLDSGKVRSLAWVLLPAILHNSVDIVRTAIRRIHSVAFINVLSHIFYWLLVLLKMHRKREVDKRWHAFRTA